MLMTPPPGPGYSTMPMNRQNTQMLARPMMPGSVQKGNAPVGGFSSSMPALSNQANQQNMMMLIQALMQRGQQ